jgi:asparagine synthetase B (glutamine-hydrolysing)
VLAAGPLALAHRAATEEMSSDTHVVSFGWMRSADAGSTKADGLAARYREHGVRAVLGPLRGSFVVLLWDARRRQGAIAGDHLGSYAIYHSQVGGRLFFASELVLLLRLLPQRPPPEPLAIVATLCGGGVPAATTL